MSETGDRIMDPVWVVEYQSYCENGHMVIVGHYYDELSAHIAALKIANEYKSETCVRRLVIE